jgi:hypothetical protein
MKKRRLLELQQQMLLVNLMDNNKSFDFTVYIHQKMLNRFCRNCLKSKIIHYPQVRKFMSFWHLSREDSKLVIEDLSKRGLISKKPHGIKLVKK